MFSKALLVKGADAESRHDDWTPFLIAAKNGHTDVVNVGLLHIISESFFLQGQKHDLL